MGVPLARRRSASSWQSRLLPTPASPTIPILPLAGEGVLQRALQRRQLLIAPDEAREPARAPDVQASAGRAHAAQLIHPHRAAGALELKLAQIAEREVALRERRRVL